MKHNCMLLFAIMPFLFLSSCTTSRYPEQTWLRYATPEEAGWSSEKLQDARDYFDQIDSAAVMVVYDGAVVAAWGDVERRYLCYSVRKSFMSAMYGIYVGKGRIDLNKTLADLKIDDVPPLNESEKQAKVVDCLTSRSGVYHDAANEMPGMTENRPKRGSHTPGEFWWYNNWGFNVLCTIFEQETNKKFFEEFRKRIAGPLRMQDFRLELTNYQFQPDRSVHPGYPFRMSARDMARFGQLYLRKGRWDNQRIIPEKWVDESTAIHTAFQYPPFVFAGYGYLWWVGIPRDFKYEDMSWSQRYEGFYSARGAGEHSIDILPRENIVFVNRVDSYKQKGISQEQHLKLLDMILKAKTTEPKRHPKLIPLQDAPKRTDIIKLDSNTLGKYVNQYNSGNYKIIVTKLNDQLLIEFAVKTEFCKFRLLPLSTTSFIAEDVEVPVSFELDSNGKPLCITIEFAPDNKIIAKPLLR